MSAQQVITEEISTDTPPSSEKIFTLSHSISASHAQKISASTKKYRLPRSSRAKSDGSTGSNAPISRPAHTGDIHTANPYSHTPQLKQELGDTELDSPPRIWQYDSASKAASPTAPTPIKPAAAKSALTKPAAAAATPRKDAPAAPTPNKASPTAPTSSTYDRIALHAVSTSKSLTATFFEEEAPPLIPAKKPRPNARKFAAQIAIQAIEILQGKRPLRQLQTWLNPQVYQALARRASLGMRIFGKAECCPLPRLRRVRACYPRPGIAEICVIVHDGIKMRAVALRLEARRRNWQVTALEII
ncbi:Rv3235 family protein [uncultured Arcanobacterium sp.]|uniref:Rv3235 family protein n=1 Tax=uncultured Arcanobacterium sp. TaxID=487520 RepID=UPI00260AF1D3|nr:Rv3235 family protein [uncultured Arcanobacterium sp.]